jgi:uncharacterized protein YjaZ
VIISKLLGKLVPLVMKAVWKQIQPELKPLQKYIYEPNINNVKISQLEDDIKEIKSKIKKQKGKKKTDDNKWYDD